MFLAAASECACATGSTSLVSLLWLLVPLGLGAVCFQAAKAKGRNRWVWGIVGFFAPLIGLLAVALLPRIKEEAA
jgi:high-affinity K+ transport system ATPase subunit B